MPEKKIVAINNKEGHRLYGILHIPAPSTQMEKRIGVNLLNPGLKNRVAPNRLYVKMAEFLVDQGYYVLRMDPAGIGDSEGELPQEPIVDIWGQIQKGLFVGDVLKMNDFFMETCRLDELLLAGSCGGAITAMLAADIDRRTSKIILIDVPVTLSSTKTITDDYLHIIEADDSYRSRLTAYYFKSLFNPQKWLRFFSMKSDYRAIIKIFLLKIRSLVKRGTGTEVITEHFTLDNFNPDFLRAFKSICASGRRILFLCAEKDTDTQLFNKGFRDNYLKEGNPYEGRYDIYTVKDANHIYTLAGSQEELIRRIASWLPR